eukprot:CAMPEP_0185907234 /NCGR_PEP_ID=MMETSP0196C-20130402/6678_1 /TAXON_ID=2932 /ORGANISM="Alexandrium fundyense, Strain CCMP1719" /LENGTH=80 /DNA_ID=CAMNT_0028627155 /DNA_START=1 /DNA_END=240 /DNA_ORIENTATION=-
MHENIVLLLPLKRKEQASSANPAQVDTSILQIVLEHPMVAARGLVEHGPHGEPIRQPQRVAPLLESRVRTLDEGVYVLVH